MTRVRIDGVDWVTPDRPVGQKEDGAGLWTGSGEQGGAGGNGADGIIVVVTT